MGSEFAVSGASADCCVEHPEPSLVRVRLTGELDAYSVPVLEVALAGRLPYLRSGGRLLVDLTEVTFLDSAGIRLVLLLVRRGGTGTTVELVPPASRTAARALQLVGFSLITVSGPAPADPG